MPNSQPKTPPPSGSAKEAEIITIIAGALAMDRSIQATAATLSALIFVPVAVLVPVLTLAMSRPIRYGITVIPSDSATAQAQALEAHYRALYVWNATQRIQAGGDIANEKRWFNQHLDAIRKRRSSAIAVDKASRRYGDLLGWHAVLDDRTSPECREANGKNFSASRIPAIGYPGAVHPYCRCRPGKKFATSQTVYGINMRVA